MISQILPFLYIGDYEGAVRLDPSLNIHYLLNCAREIPHDRRIPRHLHYTHLLLDDNDNQDLMQHLRGAFHFIEQARTHKKSVLLYSQFGISRPVALAVAYMLRFRFTHSIPPTVDEILRYVKERFALSCCAASHRCV